jgi:uroporphyrinogen decarboxylase
MLFLPYQAVIMTKFAALMNLKNDLILRAARGESVERIPVWVMRQAGRILAEYRDTRARAGSFKNLLMNSDLACEVTIQPVDILGVDAAILFSDILVIPEAMGLPYRMDEGKGPSFDETIRSASDLERLSNLSIRENLGYVFETIVKIKKDLDGRVPLIGFAGAPWTIFCYMVEGRGSKTFSASRAMLAQNPELAHALLSRITEATIIYLKEQVKNGCDMLQLFDSWAGVLNRDTYNTFALPYIRTICESIQDVPMTVFAKGAFFSLRELGALPCRTIGLDWHTDPEMAREWVGPDKTLQGNLDPAVLYGSHDFIRTETKKMIKAFGPNRYIANLGHGVYPDIDHLKLKTFIQTIQEHQF